MENLNGAVATLRSFLRANATVQGALESLDALQTLEAGALDAVGTRDRERAFHAALVAAQRDVEAAVKNRSIELGGKGSYSVVETEQIIGLVRDAMRPNGLAMATGGSEIVIIGGAPFLRCKLGLRHQGGHVEWSTHDWPLNLAGGPIAANNARRGTETSALGYYLRTMFGMERQKDEGEQYAARQQAPRSSGPRRPTSTQHRDPSVGAQAATLPSATETYGPKALIAAEAIRGANLDDLDAFESRLVDRLAGIEQGDDVGMTKEEIISLQSLVNARRAGRNA